MVEVRAGNLCHKLDIYTPSVTADAKGQRTGSDVLVKSGVYASVKTLSGREAEQAKQVFATATHQIEMRYTPNMTCKCYALFGGKKYQFGSINDVEQQHVYLKILAGSQE